MAAKNSIVTRLVLENSGFAKKLDLSKAQVRAFDREVSQVGKGFKAFLGSMGGGLMFGGLVGGFALAGSAIANAHVRAAEFEKKMSEMRSLTGLATDDLNALASAAKSIGAKYGAAAGEIVDAMKNIGGALPELLKFKEGLASVTEWVVVLSQASGLSIQEATASFTTALNQFGAGAEMAGVYANTLAAAAQAGSAEIPYLASALERVGGVAASLGMSFEDTVAVIEAIAPKFGSAEEAGTALKNMLLGLEKAGGNYAISVHGFTSALDAYLAKQPSATKMMEIFGKSGMQAGLAVQANREELTRFQKEISGTNAATEQATINTDNLKGSLDVLSSSWDSFTLSIKNSNGVLKSFVDGLSDVIGMTAILMEGENGKKNRLQNQGAKEGLDEAGLTLSDISRTEKNAKKAYGAMFRAEEKARKEYNALLRNLRRIEIDKSEGKSLSLEDAVVYKDRAYLQTKARTKFETLREARKKAITARKAPPKNEEDGPKKSAKGPTPVDPLANSRGLLAAAGLDPAAIAADMAAAKKVGEQIRELESALKATSDPALKKQLAAMLEELRGREVPADLQKIFKRLDELRDQFRTAAPDLAPVEIESLAAAALEAERLADRIRGVEAAIAATSDPALRQRLRATLKELTALRDAEYIGNGLRRPDMQNAAFKAQLKADANILNKQQKAREVHALLNPTNEWKQRRNEALGQGTTHAAIGFGADVTGVANNLVSSLGSAFSSLGLDKLGGAISTASSTISSLINVVTAASEVVNMVQSLTAAVAIPQEAANTAALVTNTGVLAANTTALVSLTSAVTTNNVLGLIPGFADGGVVGGSSFTGDKLLARVNSGERILTRRQQEHIGRALVSAQNHTATPAAQSTPANIEVSGGYSIRGEDLYVTLRNHMRTHNKKLP